MFNTELVIVGLISSLVELLWMESLVWFLAIGRYGSWPVGVGRLKMEARLGLSPKSRAVLLGGLMHASTKPVSFIL